MQTHDQEAIWLDSNDRTGLFIDGPNFHGSSRDMGFDVDYQALLNFFRQRAKLTRAFYYTALDVSGEHTPLKPLVDWLSYNGYIVVTKPTKEFKNGNGNRRIKGNMDIELAIDMLNLAQYLDHAILFSGDGDFRRLVDAVQQRGVKVTVLASSDVTADELRRQADQFVELADFRPQIERFGETTRGRTGMPDHEPS
ncbi:NYN domain-containing protein [Thiohalorhabdus methylotrophus]|uniref:NYN domain-containing protein n=1 Tax=Thiohalorhabdus methylotrophus TaxID=3242694 RepID=A0ABV4TUP6_9GAMM